MTWQRSKNAPLATGWVYWYQGKRYQGAVKAKTEKAVKGLKARVEENLGPLQQVRIEYHDGDDRFTLMISDGKLNAQPDAVKPTALGESFAQYQGDRPPGKEGNTRYTEDIHIKHLLRLRWPSWSRPKTRLP